MSLIEARDVTAGYGGGKAIRNLDLHVDEGEVVALLGPNGAGKTTTLMTLAGELRQSSGEVLWNQSTAAPPLHRRARQGLSLVAADRSVFMRLTAGQNLAIAPRCDKARAIALFPELEGLLTRRAGLLSGGEMQMLTLGRALARPTKLLLADELSLGLAPKTVERLLSAIRQAADMGMGALLVEQQLHRALAIADRVYVLRQGVLEFAGTVEEARGRISEIQQRYFAVPSPNN